jgi:hypothetical protein
VREVRAREREGSRMLRAGKGEELGRGRAAGRLKEVAQ